MKLYYSQDNFFEAQKDLEIKSSISNAETYLNISGFSKTSIDLGEKGYKIPAHANANWCFACSYKIVAHPLFNLIIVVLIIANAVVLAMD